MFRLARNLRHSTRSFYRSPGFTAAAVATLALGIAGCTVVFSVFDAVVLRPLPYGNAPRLAMVWDQLPVLGIEQLAPTIANYFDYREQNHTFEDMAAFTQQEMNVAGSPNEPAERVRAIAATGNMLHVLGIRPLIGSAGGAEDSVVLSYRWWERRFGRDAHVAGTTIRLNGQLYRVQGVMPPDVRFTIRAGPPPDVWLPLRLSRGESRTAGAVHIIGLLKAGVAGVRAQADMEAIGAGIQSAYHPYDGPHGERSGYRVRVVSLHDQLLRDLRPAAWVLFVAVAVVMIIACTNVANLLVARRVARRRDLAIRLALGAERHHLLGELAAEAIVLASCGGVLGILLARWAIQALPALTPLPDDAQMRLDWRVATFAIALVSLTAVLFELAGAWWIAMRARLAGAGMRLVGGEATRGAKLLVAAEVALSFVLVAGAGLLLKSFWQLQHVPAGFDSSGVLTMRITLPEYKYPTPRQRAAFFEGVTTKLEQTPGIESAAVVSQLPLSGGGPGGDPFSIEGRPYRANGRVPQVAALYVSSPDYFRTLRIPLLAGRLITAHDKQDGNPIAVVSDTLARGFWPSLNEALGKRVMMGAPRPGAQWLTIVGVVGDVRNAGLRIEAIPQIYASEAQAGSGNMIVVARTAGDPPAISMPARRVVSAIDPEQPVYDVKTMDQRVSASLGRDRFQTTLLTVFAFAGLMLASVGIYGVLEHSISRRIPEIGVRIAVGADRGDILRLVLRQGMTPAVLGLGTGVAGALALTRVLRSMLFGTSPSDPIMLAAAALLLGAVALVACYLPARRAMRIDPVMALRSE